MTEELTFIDLFAGCGGLALGFLLAGGYRAVGACEFDRDAAALIELELDDVMIGDPIEDVSDERWPSADVVIGGPPCQGFSQLGRRDVADPRNGLWRSYARVLNASGANVFVMENVPQLLRSDHYALFKETVVGRGFIVREQVLNAADYGVPQTRRRAIVIGSRFGPPAFPARPMAHKVGPTHHTSTFAPPSRVFRRGQVIEIGTMLVRASDPTRLRAIERCLHRAATGFRCRRISRRENSAIWCRPAGAISPLVRRTSSGACGGIAQPPRFAPSSSNRRKAGTCTPRRIGPSPCARLRAYSPSLTPSSSQRSSR